MGTQAWEREVSPEPRKDRASWSQRSRDTDGEEETREADQRERGREGRDIDRAQQVGGGSHLCARLACMGQGSSREGVGSFSSFWAVSAKAWMRLSPSSSLSSSAPQGSTPGPRYRRVAALGSSFSTEDSDGPGQERGLKGP